MCIEIEGIVSCTENSKVRVTKQSFFYLRVQRIQPMCVYLEMLGVTDLNFDKCIICDQILLIKPLSFFTEKKLRTFLIVSVYSVKS